MFCAQCYFRGAKAAVDLKEYSEAIALCQEGLKRDANNKDLKDILAKVRTLFYGTISTYGELTVRVAISNAFATNASIRTQ